MADRPPIGSSILAKKSQARSCGGRAIRLLSIFLSVLKTSKHPTSFAFLELAISVPFNGENPSASDEVLGLELPDSTRSNTSLSNQEVIVDEVKHIVIKPGGNFR